MGTAFLEAVITKDGKIVSEADEQCGDLKRSDCSCRNSGIRKASEYLGTHNLSDCVLYTSCDHVLCVWEPFTGPVLRKLFIQQSAMTQKKPVQ